MASLVPDESADEPDTKWPVECFFGDRSICHRSKAVIRNPDAVAWNPQPAELTRHRSRRGNKEVDRLEHLPPAPGAPSIDCTADRATAGARRWTTRPARPRVRPATPRVTLPARICRD